MAGFGRDDSGRATLGGALLGDLLAEAHVSTPAYVYDLDGIEATTRALVGAFGSRPHMVGYAVKANTAGSIVKAVARAGGGADVVSGGELEVVLSCGIPPERVVMSGVGKLAWELDLAIGAGIRAIQIESVEEIERVAARAHALGQRANVSLRVNPNVNIDSHAHVATGHDEAKFGIVRADFPRALSAIDAAKDELELVGVSTHVGSMLQTADPFVESARVVCDMARSILDAGRTLAFVDFGGGFGIDYGSGPVAPPPAFAQAVIALVQERGLEHLTILVEPGRALVAPFGVLVAHVIGQKQSGDRRWCIVDAGMNDLIRPALYAAHHRIEPLDRLPGGSSWRVVGPVCESSDDFGLHPLGETLPTDVVIRDAGAYGYAMASEYNGRAVPSEVFVSQGRVASVSRTPGVEAWVRSRLGA
jgi:diaminopimelate decarboxylase